MTAYVKTISVAVSIFGPEPTEKWSATATTALAMLWGTDKWGYGTVGLPLIFYKGISNSLTPSTNIAFRYYVFPKNDISLSSVIGKNIAHFYVNSQAVTNGVGKTFGKYAGNTSVVTATNSRGFYKRIFEASTIAVTLDRGSFYNITTTNSVSPTTSESVKKYRDGYVVTYGGQEEVTLYPRPTVLTAAAQISSTWTLQTTSATTWS